MKFTKFILLLLLLFSCMTDILVSAVDVHAQTKEKVLVDTKDLKLSYNNEIQNEKNNWELHIVQQKMDNSKEFRVKMKLTDENEALGEEFSIDGMEKKEGWLVEKEFNKDKQKSFSFTTNKEINNLQLYVQLDERIDTDTVEKHNKENGGELKSDILDEGLIGPYELTSSGEESEQIVESSSQGQSLENSSPFEENILEKASNAPITQLAGEIYETMEPVYTTDSTGTYPKYSWKPTNAGQENVINHQGGWDKNGGTKWYSKPGWDVSNDTRSKTSQAYISYGGQYSTHPEIAIRKYVKQLSAKDEFEIKLNVYGKKEFQPGVDVVLLLDNSFSMISDGKKQKAVAATKKLVESLQSIDGGDIRVGLEIFSDYSYGTAKVNYPLTSTKATWKKYYEDYEKASPDGTRTFTQRGVASAHKIFKNANITGRKKMLFILTDGVPNLSWKPTMMKSDSNMFPDKYHIIQSNDGSGSAYGENFDSGDFAKLRSNGLTVPLQTGGSAKIYSHLTPANSVAQDLKNDNIEIRSIGVGIKSPSTIEHTTEELIKGLYKMASKRANATGEAQKDYFYQNASNIDDLTEDMKDWYLSIVQPIQKGVLKDPMGDMVDLDSGSVQCKQVAGEALDNSSKPKNETAGRTINFSNINLMKGQEIEITYKVKLKSSAVSGKWYPTNGLQTTILEPAPDRSPDKLKFGSPSVRKAEEKISIPVEKKWVGDTNNTNLRPASVTVELQKSSSQNGPWSTVGTKTLSSSEFWKGTFTNVDNQGTTYFKLIEKNAVPGYTSVDSAPITKAGLGTNSLVVTNTLKKADFTFTKFKEDGLSYFPTSGSETTRPGFTIYRKSDNVQIGSEVFAGNQGKVTFTGLEPGVYTVKETNVPDGYQEMIPFELKIEVGSGTDLVIKVDGIANSDYKVTNELEVPTTDFTFIKYKDQENSFFPTSGTKRPAFTIYDSSNKIVQENKYPDASGKVVFTDLTEGTYRVVESIVPEDYVKMSDFNVVVEKSSGNTVVAKVDGSTTLHKVTNHQQEYSLEVNKIDGENQEISGAAFELTGPDGYSRALSTGAVFNFENLKSGAYTLTETKAPDGFKKLSTPIMFIINTDGEVHFDSHDSIKSPIERKNNKISIKVKNTSKGGWTPNTGRGGRKGIILLSISLFGGACLLSVGYLLFKNIKPY